MTVPISHVPVVASVRRRLLVATALAGLGFAQSAVAVQAGTDDPYWLGGGFSGCGGAGSCTLTSPTSVWMDGALTYTGQGGAAVLLLGSGAAMATTIGDASLPTILSKSNPGSDRTTIDALSATYRSILGVTPQIDMPLTGLISSDAAGTYAKADILRAVSALDVVQSVLGTNPSAITSVDAASAWVSGRSNAQLLSTLQPELASLSWAADGTTSATAAQVAVASILFRSLTDADITTRDGAFLSQLLTIANADGTVSLSAVKAMMNFDQLPADQQAYYTQSIQRLMTILAGVQITGGNDPTFKAIDFVRAAEADGSAYDVVYGQTNNTPSQATTVSVRDLLRMSTLQNATFAKNVTSLFLPSISDYLTGATSGATAQGAYASALMASNTLTLRSSGRVTATSGSGIVANNTGAITLVSDATVTATGTSIDGLAAYGNGASGDVAVTNRGLVTVTGNDSVGVKGKVSAGTGTVLVTNEGAVVVSGQGSAGVRAKSVDGGAATAANAATGTVDVSGSGSAAVYASATTSDASVSNAGTITVHDGAAAGIVASSNQGALASAVNTGTINLTSDAIGTSKSGAIVAGGGVSVARVVNSGTVIVVGDAFPALRAMSGAATGTAEATNTGVVSVTGSEAAGMLVSTGGTGSARATNSGRLSVGGTSAAGVVAASFGGAAVATNEAGGRVEIGGFGSRAVDVSSTTGTAAATNAGTVSVTDGFLGVVAFSDSNASSVTNIGTVTLVTDGRLQQGTVDGLGVSLVGALAAGTGVDHARVENRGTIDVTGASTRAILTVAERSGGSVSVANSGTVKVQGAGGIGIHSVTVDGAVGIENSGAIDVGGQGATGVVARSEGSSIRVTNSGSITAPAAISADAGSGTVFVENSGTITGSVALAGDMTTMTNSGAVIGTVTLGAGDGTFVLTSGAGVGKVVAGAGRTLLDVREADGRLRSLDAANFVGFRQASLTGDAGWLLSGDFSSTAFSIGGGRAQVAGGLGAVDLAAGTTLMGTGSVASLASKGATIAPGDTLATTGLGTITVDGDLGLDRASTVLVDVEKDKSDRIVVKGTAQLAGVLLLRGTDVVGGKTLTIIDAKAVEQTFSTATWTEAGKWDFLKMEVVYTPTSVTVKTTDPVTTAKETMQTESKAFLTSVFGETPVLQTTESQTAYQTIGNLISDAKGDAGKIQKTMDEVSGKATVVAANAGTVAVQAVDQAVSRASDAALGGASAGATGGGMSMAYVEDPAEAAPAQRAIGRVLHEKVPAVETRSLIAWTTGQFGFGSASNGGAHSDFRSGGITIGLIKRIDEAFSVGFAGGYTRSNISVENPNASLGIDSYHMLLHGTWDTDAFRLNGLVGHAVQQFGGQRAVAGGNAASSYGGGSVRVGIDGGYKIKWNQHEFMPFAGLDVIHGWTSGYTETGAPGGLNLTYDATSTDTVDGRIGLKWSARHQVSPGVRVEPMASVAWIHSFGNVNPSIHGSMLGNSFVMTGASRSREALAVSTGLSTEIGENFSVFGRYSGRLASDTTAHDFSAGLRYKW